MAKMDKFTYSVTFKGDQARIYSWGAGGVVEVEHRTEHYVVTRTKGANCWSGSGSQSFQPGSVEIREIHCTEHQIKARRSDYRVDADRTWRTQVKAAIAKANEMEAAWETMNAERDARFAGIEAEKAAEEKKAEKAKYIENVYASETCDTVRFWVDEIREMAKREGVEMSPEDARRIIVRAVDRAAGGSVA